MDEESKYICKLIGAFVLCAFSLLTVDYVKYVNRPTYQEYENLERVVCNFSKEYSVQDKDSLLSQGNIQRMQLEVNLDSMDRKTR